MLDVEKPHLHAIIRSMLRDKHKLYRKYLKNPFTYGDSYLSLRNRLNWAIRSAKTKHFENKFTKCAGDSQKNLSVIHEILGNKADRNMINELNVDGQIVGDNFEISNKFNKFFVDVGDNLRIMINSSVFSVILYLPCFDLGKFLSRIYIKSLKILKLTPLEMIIFSCRYTQTFSTNIQQGIFPSNLKAAKVKLIHKSGDKTVLNIYRLISLLPDNCFVQNY